MQIIVNGRNIEITPAIKAYVKEKMGKVVEHYDQMIDFEVILTVIKNPSVADSHIAEAKCNIAGARIHIEEKAESMYASIDLLADGTYFFHGDSLGLQGLNGWIFSLISLDAKNTAVPENAKFTREDMLDAILSAQEADGGFGLSSGSSNADITAMAVQALAPYKDRSDVSEAIEKALGFMSDIMTDEGRFIAYGEESSETISQLIIALCSVGIDPMEDERFVKGGKNLLQHAESYLCKDGGFSHSYGHDDSDFMATQQMLLALTSVKLLRERECRLYDLSEYDSPEIKITDEDAGSFPTAAVVIFIAAAAIIIIGIIVKTRGKKNV